MIERVSCSKLRKHKKFGVLASLFGTFEYFFNEIFLSVTRSNYTCIVYERLDDNLPRNLLLLTSDFSY